MPIDQNDVARAQSALAVVRHDWMSRPGVISVEVARRWIDGAPTDAVGLRVTVERKIPNDHLPADQVLPDEVDGFDVDVREGHAPTLD